MVKEKKLTQHYKVKIFCCILARVLYFLLLLNIQRRVLLNTAKELINSKVPPILTGLNCAIDISFSCSVSITF